MPRRAYSEINSGGLLGPGTATHLLTKGALRNSECIDQCVECTAVQEGAPAVVDEVSESKGVAAQGFQAAVDGFGGSVGGVVIEERQDVVASASWSSRASARSGATFISRMRNVHTRQQLSAARTSSTLGPSVCYARRARPARQLSIGRLRGSARCSQWYFTPSGSHTGVQATSDVSNGGVSYCPPNSGNYQWFRP